MQLLDELALLSVESSYDDNKKVVDNSLKYLVLNLMAFGQIFCEL